MMDEDIMTALKLICVDDYDNGDEAEEQEIRLRSRAHYSDTYTANHCS